MLATNVGNWNPQLAVSATPNDHVSAQRDLLGAGFFVDDFKPYVHVNSAGEDGAIGAAHLWNRIRNCP